MILVTVQMGEVEVFNRIQVPRAGVVSSSYRFLKWWDRIDHQHPLVSSTSINEAILKVRRMVKDGDVVEFTDQVAP